MQRIPLHNADDFLLCDDEDFAELSKYEWSLYRLKTTLLGWVVKAPINVPDIGRIFVYPGALLFPYSTNKGTVWGFKDLNCLNWQRDNITRTFGGNKNILENKKHIDAPWCPFGAAKLVPAQYVFTGQPQRASICLTCDDHYRGPYWHCLKEVIKTGWLGWRREDE